MADASTTVSAPNSQSGKDEISNEKDGEVDFLGRKVPHSSTEIVDTSSFDPILTRKMILINNAVDEIGMTPFHWKLFFLNGFGYAVDSVSPSTN